MLSLSRIREPISGWVFFISGVQFFSPTTIFICTPVQLQCLHVLDFYPGLFLYLGAMEWMPFEDYLAEQEFLAKREQEFWDMHRTIWTPEMEQEELYYIKHGEYPD